MHGGPASRGLRRSTAAVAPIALATSMLLGSCTDDPETAPTTSLSPPTTVVEEEREDDGRLSIGLLLPTDAPLVADAISTVAQGLVEEINAAGGVLGEDVELVPLDEGSSTSDVTQAITDLVERGVDAIIGPITSDNAVTAVDIASTARLVTCSPTATAAILDDVPDDMLFFRTIASDSMQAIAIAEAAENTGARTVAIAHIDDVYGRPYADAVEVGLADRAVELVGSIGFSRDDDLSVVADEVADADADVVILLAAGPDLAAFLTALAATDVAVDTIITNDAIRTATNQPIVAELPDDLRNRLLGVAPQITDRRADAPAAVFGPQVTDCITLLALSAVQAGSDNPRLIAGQMAPVSSGGRLCRTFEACAAQIEQDRQIDYNGPTGLTELNRVGETSRAWFERFTFEPDGTDRSDTEASLQISI